MNKAGISLIAVSAVTLGAQAAGPQGLRFFGGKLTVKPYVSASYTYDSNIDTTKHGSSDSTYSINPGASFQMGADRWSLGGGVWYRYRAYDHRNSTMGNDSYGENISWSWANSEVDARGWSLFLGQTYTHTMQADSLNSGEGRGVWRDREVMGVNGGVERRFSSRLHAGVTGSYSWMDYKNSAGYAPLYGYDSYSVGASAGVMISPLTDFSLYGSWGHYRQKGSGVAHNSSQSYSIHAGIGTRATKRITYNLSAGMSGYESNHSGSDHSFSYNISANWRLTDRWNMSLSGSSYYRPSETNRGGADKNWTVSYGTSYLLGEGLSVNANVAWRYKESIYSGVGNYGGDENIVSFRLGASYTFNRWLSTYANVGWEEEWYEHGGSRDYDRYRFEVGMMFHY